MSSKNNKKSVIQQAKVSDEKQVASSTTAVATKRKVILNSPEDYSSSSQIAKAYSAGCFPNFTHQKLFHALSQALEGKDEGRVDFNKVLEDASMHRSSALQIIILCLYGIKAVTSAVQNGVLPVNIARQSVSFLASLKSKV